MRTLCGLVVAAGLLAPLPAYGFVCTAVPNSSPPLTQVWNQRCLPYRINTNGAFFSRSANQSIVRRSFEEWSSPSCTDLVFQFNGSTNQGAEFDPDAGASNQNVVLATNTVAEAIALIGEPNLLAITLTSFSVETGEILDADIIINAATFTFEEVADPATCQSRGELVFDLANTMVHEIGHFIGFDHTPDNQATMFETASACEVLKRDLNATDLDGLCTVYADGMPPQTCDPAPDYGSGGFLAQFRDQCGGGDDGGCACVAAASPAPVASRTWLWGLLPLVAVAPWARRRRQRKAGR